MGSDDGASGQRQPKSVLRGIQETTWILCRPYGRGNGHESKTLNARAAGGLSGRGRPLVCIADRANSRVLDKRNVASCGSSSPRSWSYGRLLDGDIVMERPAF